MVLGCNEGIPNMEEPRRRLCVFCSSKAGDHEIYASYARRLGKLMPQRGLGLVFGGGHIGLMGILADAILGKGGEAIGVIPKSMMEAELAHTKLTKLHIVETMHQRKTMMAELADGFVALPGGFGTGDELFEILTWAQLRYHSKPVGVLNVNGFFDSLLAWLDRAVIEGFLKNKHRKLLIESREPEELLDRLWGDPASRKT
jgi:uncharacterized protein (TIGR00730 family)